MLKGGLGKNECLGGFEDFLPQISVWGAYYVSSQRRLCKIKYGFEGLISNDDHGSRPGSTY